MTDCLRCAICGSTLGPGCDCMTGRYKRVEWKNTAAGKYGGGRKPLDYPEFKPKNETSARCIKCGNKFYPIRFGEIECYSCSKSK